MNKDEINSAGSDAVETGKRGRKPKEEQSETPTAKVEAKLLPDGYSLRGLRDEDNYKKFVDHIYGEILDKRDPKQLRGGGSLVDTKKYDFDVYRVKPRRVPINPRRPNEGTEIVGIEIVRESPVFSTSTFWKYAREMNMQLHSDEMNYYIPKEA